MSPSSKPVGDSHVLGAEVLVPCTDLDASLAFYVGELGFRLDMTQPADAPSIALVSGHGLSIRLHVVEPPARTRTPVHFRIPASASGKPESADNILQSPDGDLIELIGPTAAAWPNARSNTLIVQRCDAPDDWVTGRAGMQYRDLIPGRLDGAVIASHIRIPEGGPVPDYVHFHEVDLQLIYCRRGWVRVVYEDQGPPFVMHAGDCVLQPPTIRHRVLESSAGLEVVELSSPAGHETWREHDLALPTSSIAAQRIFRGQHFVRHVAAQATWKRDPTGMVRFRDTGIAEATGGLARVRVLELAGEANAGATTSVAADAFHFLFVLSGSLVAAGDAFEPVELRIDDACVVPSEASFQLSATQPCEVLEIAMPTDRNNPGQALARTLNLSMVTAS